MLRTFKINPTIAKYLEGTSWTNDTIISRVNEFTEESATKLAAEISAAHYVSQDTVVIVIDSYGGQVDALSSMISSIQSSVKPVMTVVQGKAMSCGAFLAGFGTVGLRYAAPDSRILFHSMHGGVHGNPDDIKAVSENMMARQKHFCKKLAKHCGNESDKFWLDMLQDKNNADIYLTPKQAVKHKLVDHIGLPTMNIEITYSVTIK